MKYRRLGRTGFEVSEIGHSLWGMGGWTGSDDDTSMRALQSSLERGCNFFDSAWAYGDGKSDTLLAQLIQRNPGTRIYVAAKIPPKNMKWPGSHEDGLTDVYPPDHIEQYTALMAKTLGIECIDLLQFHVWDDAWADDDSWVETVGRLKKQGRIRSFGLSLNRWEPENGLAALRRGCVDTMQVIYNIFDQAPEDRLFPVCKDLDVGVIARVPLDEGSLGGNFTRDTKFPPDDWRSRYFGPENLPQTVERVGRLKELVPTRMTLPEMALRFILANAHVHTTIVGMRKLRHVTSNTEVSDGAGLADELVEKLRAHRWDRSVTPWAN